MIYEVNIPKGWHEVSLKKFEELSTVIDKSSGNPYEITARTIAVLTGLDYETIRKWPVSVLNSTELAKSLRFVTTEPQKRMPDDTVILGGKMYKVFLYPQKWTAGQWLDYTSVMKDENTNAKLARIIACFVVPKGCEYGEGYEYDDVVKAINENIDIETALGMAGFFQLEFSAFVKALLAYSERKTKRLKRSIRKQENRSSKKLKKSRG